MLSTHNLKTITPKVLQKPLCVYLSQNISPLVISSKTIKIRKMVWNEAEFDSESNFNVLEQPSFNNQPNIGELNSYYERTRTLPREILKDRLVTDTNVRLVHLYFDPNKSQQSCISLSPICSTGLINEIILRGSMRDDVLLKSNKIECMESNWKNHGTLVEQNQGKIKCFDLNHGNGSISIDNTTYTKENENYIILEFELLNQFVATGQLSVGLPTLVSFGTFVNNQLQRNNHLYGDLEFAIGIKSIKKAERGNVERVVPQNNSIRHKNYNIEQSRYGYNKRDRLDFGWKNTNDFFDNKDESILDQKSRVADIQGYIVIKTNCREQQLSVLQKLSSNVKISGKELNYKNYYVSNLIPNAFWFRQMNKEVLDVVKTGRDALDASFDFKAEDIMFLPIISGYGLLSAPREYRNLENFRYTHGWAESLYVNTELKVGDFSPKYLFKRKFNNSVILWTQELLDV